MDTSKRTWDDSLISMGLGALVVVVAGILMYNYFFSNNTASRRTAATSPSPTVTASAVAANPSTATSAGQVKHVVARGESLWTIAEKYYKGNGDGYRYKEIVSANNLKTGAALETGTELIIPNANAQISASSTVASTSPTATAVAQATLKPSTTPVITPSASPSVKPSATASTTPVATSVAQATTQPTLTPSISPSTQPTVAQAPQTQTDGKITYTVVRGDNLWSIAQSACGGNGYAWSGIAQQNKLANPSVIHSGNVLTFTCSGS